MKKLIDNILHFLNKPECTHSNVSYGKEMSYCPDCGELISINWYLLRCNCCNTKRIGYLRNGEVYPVTQYCENCGNHNYSVEKLNKINYFDLHYAVAKTEIIDNKLKEKRVIQIWIEGKNPDERTTLLPRFTD
ncbi:MAG: hypothetical protein WC197_01540 [Candidatus Gastranaerophilaceae bacterium]